MINSITSPANINAYWTDSEQLEKGSWSRKFKIKAELNTEY